MEHPNFFALTTALPRTAGASRREVADIQTDVPGGRVRRTMRDTSRDPHHSKGGIQMAKKAAKGAKKKAAKKR